MEYMMIRSMKSGGKNDPSTPTLTMIPDHHNHNHHNNHIQHQQQMQVHQQQQQQQQQQQRQQQQQQQQQHQQQQQSLAEQQVNDLYTAMNCGDLSNSSISNDINNSNWSNNLLGGSIQLQQSGNASSTIPIHFKSTEIYERIVASSSVSTQSGGTVQLSNFGGSSSLNHIIKSENLYGQQLAKNHIVQRSTQQQQFVLPSTYQPEQFQSGLVVSNSSSNNSKQKSVKKAKMKVHKRKRKLWEYSYAKRSASQVESSKAAASLAAAGSNSHSNSNAIVSLARKRKASSNSLQSAVTKRQKGSWIPVNNAVASGNASIVKQSSLCSQMPNLLKAFQVPEEADKCIIRSELMQPKIEKIQSKLTVTPSRPDIPIENIFLKKYDPIRLLSRLCASRVKSEAGTTVEKKALVGKTFTRVSNNSSPRLKTEMFKSNIFGQNYTTKSHQSSSGLPSCLNNVVKFDSLMKPPNLLSMRSIKKSKSKSKHLRSTGVLGRRKTSRKLKRKRLRKYPKFVKPKRKLNVKFISPATGVPQLRVRVLAAIYLKRALSRLRRGRRPKGRRYTSLDKVKRSHKRLKSPKPPETAIEVLKTGKGSSANCVRKFQLANVKIPKAIPVSTVKVNFPNNQYLYNTIELLRHKRELQDRLESMESDGTVYRLGSLPDTPEPAKPTFISQNVMMKQRQVKTVLSERLLLNFAHAGFTHTTLRPLEVAADIVADFLMKTAKRLKDVAEVEMMGADHGFPDAMERVLNEMGMGGIRGLEEFYRSKVVDYGQRMEDQCSVLRRQFAYKVRSKVGLGNSTSTSSTPSPTTPATVTVSSGGSGSRPVINTSKTASTSSSQPLSPGNSMLAEILSSQEELSGRTILASSSPSMGEKQLEDLMVAPPNVEIRPNSYHSRQQLPLHQLLASLSQQSHQQVVAQPQLVRAAPPNQATAPVILNQAYQNQSLQHQQQQQQQQSLQQNLHQQQQAQQQQQSQSNVLQASTPPQYTLAGQNTNHQHHTLHSSSQGLHHSQPHLTQLLQRPITNQASPTNHLHHLHHPTTTPQSPQHQQHQHHHLVIQSPGQVHQSQYQSVPLQQAPPASIAQLQNSSNQVNQLRSVVSNNNNNNNNRPLITMPIQISLQKQGHQSPVLKTEIPCTVPAVQSPSSKLSIPTKPKTVTIIRSNSASSPGIIVSNDNRPGSNSSAGTVDVLPEFHSPHGGSNVISINLGSNSIDLDHSNVPQTVTMHAADPGITAGGTSTGSSKAKLKEAINQRNLLRLNFEQVPNTGESTVLLFSSSTPVANATGNVQFVGKVTPGQTITWNSNYQ